MAPLSYAYLEDGASIAVVFEGGQFIRPTAIGVIG